jgi:hypothetical protein
VGGEELPDDLGERPAGDGARRLVAAAVEPVVDDLGAVAAAVPAHPGHLGGVEEDGRVAGAAVPGGPLAQPGGQGRSGRGEATLAGWPP